MIFSALILTACGQKKPQQPEAPKEGWVQEEGSSVACYYPPKFDSLEEMPRREARSEALDALIEQWKGARNDGVSMNADVIESIENIVLGDMSKIESVARDNLSYCKQFASSSSKASWESWLSSLPVTLTEGECNYHFSVIMSHTVEIDVDWEPGEPIRICSGDKIRVMASPNDRFQLEPGGTWITVDGNPEVSTAGNDAYPCQTEGCLKGQLVLRFLDKDGGETIVPIGSSGIFTAPADGVFSYGINDNSPEDNKWYNSSGVIEHASIEIRPVQ